MKNPNETYLGSRVFASFDGFYVHLRTDDGARVKIDKKTLREALRFCERADLSRT